MDAREDGTARTWENHVNTGGRAWQRFPGKWVGWDVQNQHHPPDMRTDYISQFLMTQTHQGFPDENFRNCPQRRRGTMRHGWMELVEIGRDAV
jgi:hypothetical protein